MPSLEWMIEQGRKAHQKEVMRVQKEIEQSGAPMDVVQQYWDLWSAAPWAELNEDGFHKLNALAKAHPKIKDLCLQSPHAVQEVLEGIRCTSQ